MNQDILTVLCEVQNFTESVVWTNPSNLIPLNIGVSYLGGSNLTGDRNIFSVGNNTDVNVQCVSGDCNFITTTWNATTDMSDTDVATVDFVCSVEQNGFFSADFNVFSSEDYEGDVLTVDCNVNDVFWVNTISVSLNAFEGATNPTDSKDVNSIGANFDVNVECISGNCPTTIYTNWVNTTDMFNEILPVNFYCNTSTVGSFSADFNVFSLQDLNEMTLSVECSITDSNIDWNMSSLNLGSVELFVDHNGDANIISTGVNENVTVSCVDGNCVVITDNWVDGSDLGNEKATVNFDCNSDNVGLFSADFNVTSDQDLTPKTITVSCEVTYPQHLLDLQILSVDLPGQCNELFVNEPLTVKATVRNNSASTIISRNVFLKVIGTNGYTCNDSQTVTNLTAGSSEQIENHYKYNHLFQ